MFEIFRLAAAPPFALLAVPSSAVGLTSFVNEVKKERKKKERKKKGRQMC